MRSFAFNCAVVLVFLRFSFLHETISYLTGINTYVLYIFGPLVLIGVIAYGGLQRTFRYTPAQFWLAFLVCMVAAVPFSTWKGNSFMLTQNYIRTNFMMLVVTAGLALTWVECRRMMYAIAGAVVVNLVTTRALMNQAASGDRLVLQSRGMISDPNDLAAHLLLVLPFLLFVVLRRRTPVYLRVILAGALGYGIFLVLRGGSRGGFVALTLTMVFILVIGSVRQKIAIGIAAPIMFVLFSTLLPGATWKRLTSFSAGEQSDKSAIESSEARKYLLRKSIEYTFKKPLFGVGPGQFMTYEGKEAAAEGRHGSWHVTHNSYTQISSECGIPALLFYLGTIISTFWLLRKIRKKALKLGEDEIVTATFCITIGLFAYSAACVFLSLGYMFQFPAVSGLVIAIWRSVSRARRNPRPIQIPTEQAQTLEPELKPLTA